MVQYLLEQRVDKDKAANNGDATPLFIAALKGHLAVVECLVEEPGVDVNKATTDGNGFTPLHSAVENGHIDIVVCLMERGMANLNARTRDGRRPMDVADNDEMKQAIINEEKRRRDHGFKRSVIPPTTINTEGEQRVRRKRRRRASGSGCRN